MASMPAVRGLDKISTFVRVAERRNFTKAARDLRLSPSVVSRHISELEENLGFSLLHRSTHGVALTAAGEDLFNSCLEMLERIDGLAISARNLQAGPCGELRIQATNGYARWILAPLMSAFIRRYPQVRVELITEGASPNPVENGCDVVVAKEKPAAPGLIGREIGAIQHVICAAPEYFRRHGRPSGPQDLSCHNCLVNSSFAPKEWTFRWGRRETTVKVKGTFSSSSSAILMQVALDGLGIIRVPRYAARAELASGRLESIFDDITYSNERIHAYYPKAKYLPAKTAAFVDFLEKALASERE